MGNNPLAPDVEPSAWKRILDDLRGAMDPVRFDRFVRPLRLVGLDADEARIETPDGTPLTAAGDDVLRALHEAIEKVLGPRRVVLDVARAHQGELFPAPAARRRARDIETRHTFETFVVGASNQFAQAACLAVARQPGAVYNPLFVYGGSGLGKTHLASAIARAIEQADPDANVIYVTSERFTTDLIDAIRSNRVAAFKRRYRAATTLILDDVHRLSGRDRTQEEFFHTFNALHDQGRQIVVTSDKAPEDIPGLEDRLRNRLQWGLVVDLQPPDLETRVAILQHKAAAIGLTLPEDAAMALAAQCPGNVRSLEGTLMRLAARASLERTSISAGYVHALAESGALGRHGPVSFEEIARAVCERYELTVQQLLSRRRTKRIALPRQVAMYLCRRLLGASYPRIGNLFGRDHTTALHGVRAIATRLERDAALQETVQTIERGLARRL